MGARITPITPLAGVWQCIHGNAGPTAPCSRVRSVPTPPAMQPIPSDSQSANSFITIGAVSGMEDSFRAHARYRDSEGMYKNIIGPRRDVKRRAEEDLESMRGAAAEKLTRHEGLEAMAAEARRLQEQAEFEAHVALVAMQQFDDSQQDSQMECVGDSQMVDEYYDDHDEEWQDIEVPQPGDSWGPTPQRISMPVPKNAVEATALLSKFRPIRSTVQDLKMLLENGADVNIRVSGGICPLENVIIFARNEDVAAMRSLLLNNGAVETTDLAERWHIRRRADENHDAWMRNFHRDDR